MTGRDEGAVEGTVRRITRNRARCRQCGDVVESTHRHDYRVCRCGAIAVDGGRSYMKRSGDPNACEELSEFEPASRGDESDARVAGLGKGSDMRINIYSEEVTARIEIVQKEAEGRQFVGLRFYLLSHPNMHPPAHQDDDTSAVTFWSADGLEGICKLANQIGDALRGARLTLPSEPEEPPP